MEATDSLSEDVTEVTDGWKKALVIVAREGFSYLEDKQEGRKS